MAARVRSHCEESRQLWQSQGGGVTAGAGGQDRGADTGRGSSGSTDVTACAGWSVSSEWTGQGGGVTAGAGGQDPGADTGRGSSGSTGVTACAGWSVSS